MAIVINLKDADGKECTCKGSSSWLTHWELHKDIDAIFCRACNNKHRLVGTLVKRPELNEKFILPVCLDCFQKKDELTIWSYNELVPAECGQMYDLLRKEIYEK